MQSQLPKVSPVSPASFPPPSSSRNTPTGTFWDASRCARLSSPTPLADVFKEFENRETDYMDVVRESMASRADTIIDRHQAPLYRHDAAYAAAHNEMEHYTASLRVSAACKNMIEDAIAAAYQDTRMALSVRQSPSPAQRLSQSSIGCLIAASTAL